MKIGIDISQIAYEGTGVAQYVRLITEALMRTHPEHEYVLFGASLRKKQVFFDYVKQIPGNPRLVVVTVPPTILDWLWNRLHIVPIEWFIGAIDVFWSSDWTQPPLSKARGITTIHDLSIMRFPEESHNKAEVRFAGGTLAPNIVATQKRRLMRATGECQAFLCDSEATKKDAHTLLNIPFERLHVVYPGYKGAAL